MAISESNTTPGKTENTVLIVEDEPDYVRLLGESFKNMGYQIVTANGGHEAYWYLEKRRTENAAGIVLVVSDWMMAEGDGLWLLHAIRNGPCRETPFLLISGAVNREQLMGVIQMDADAVLLKPFSFEMLRAEAHEAMNRRAIKEANKVIKGR